MEASAKEVRVGNNLAALNAIASIAQREDAMAREAANSRRAGIATVLGFDGVLIGLAVFATGEVASSEGVLAGTGPLDFFAVAAGLAIFALVVAGMALLVALWMDGSAVLTREALAELDTYVGQVEGGAAANPTNAVASGIRLLIAAGKLLDTQREKADKQRCAARVGLVATGCGFFCLAAAGLIVVGQVLFG